MADNASLSRLLIFCGFLTLLLFTTHKGSQEGVPNFHLHQDIDRLSKDGLFGVCIRQNFFRQRIMYYSNHVASFGLAKPSLVNVHPNPGPEQNLKGETSRVSKRLSSLNCLSLNARSIVHKTLDLHGRLSGDIKYDLVAITETWLDCSINTSEIFPDCFMVHRKDRSRHGGGVLLACGVELSCVRREDFETNFELLWCKVTVCNPKKSMLVGVYYRPPATDIAYLEELGKSLSLIEESRNNLDIVLLGDFNLPNISWLAVNPYGNDTISSVFCDIIQDYFLYQLILEPTRDGIF